jgi:hypothetical protein
MSLPEFSEAPGSLKVGLLGEDQLAGRGHIDPTQSLKPAASISLHPVSQVNRIGSLNLNAADLNVVLKVPRSINYSPAASLLSSPCALRMAR